MLHSGGLFDAAFRRNLVDAKRGFLDEQPDDFDTTVVCETRHHFYPPAISGSHEAKYMDLWQ